jgi:hypothetical protein
MSLAADQIEDPRADVGWIVTATLNVMWLRRGDLGLVALVFVWAPNFLAEFLPTEVAAFRALASLPSLVFFGGASLIAYQEMVGEPRITVLGAMAVGLRRFFTLFMINAVSTILAFVGLILLVVPGIFVLAAFMVATAAAVAERKGSTAALERAWNLSRGSRGRLAALVGIAIVAYVLLLLAGGAIGVAIQLLGAGDRAMQVGQFVLAPVIATVLFAYTTVGAAAAYVNLRNVREGPIGVADAFA